MQIISLLRKWTPLLAPILFFAALWVLHRELENFHYRDVVNQLHQIPIWRIAFAILFTFFSYSTLTLFDVLAFRYLKISIPYKITAPISFISYALGNNIGNTLITGGSVRLRMYSSQGIGALDITAVTGFCGLIFWLGFISIAGFSFTLDPPDVLSTAQFHFLSMRWLGFIFLLLTSAYLLTAFLLRTPIQIRNVKINPPSGKIALSQIVLGAIDISFAAATLYILLPESVSLSYISFISVFLLALIAGLISQVPGGYGVFETAILVLLGNQADNSEIVGSLLIFRAIYYLLPLSAGALLLGTLEFKQQKNEWRDFAQSIYSWVPVIIPHVLSIMIFFCGLILLFSGATPSKHSRLGELITVLPFSILELSHFLGSIAGIGLVLLAHSIQRRIDAAYYMTVLLLLAGIIFSLLKGLDYEEAILLSVMLFALLPCHSQFYRKSSLLSGTLSTGWILTITLLLLAYLWIGLFSYKHVAYSNELWWRFSLLGDAPRFLRASVGVIGVMIIFAIVKLLRPSPHEPVLPDSIELEQASSIIRTNPKTYANLAFLGDKALLFSESKSSFLMYAVEGRSWIALGNPIGPEAEWMELIWKFREMVDRHAGWTVFYQIDSNNLYRYIDLGLTLLKIGEEACVPLETFTLEGGARKGLRQTLRKAEKAGCVFEIIQTDQIALALPEIKKVSDSWLNEKNTHEKGFSLGFFNEEYLKHFPCAVVKQNEEIIAFANIFTSFNEKELSVDLIRFTSQAPRDVMEFLFIKTILWGIDEQFKWFNLGMAPLSGLENHTLSPLWNRIGGLIFRHGEHFYNFEGLRRYKNKFGPVWKSKYIAVPNGWVTPKVLMDLTALISGDLKGVFIK